MTTVQESESVECRNVPGDGPNGGRLQCRSCGRWLDEEHHAGCPVGQAAQAAAMKAEREAQREALGVPEPELAAQVEAPADAPPIGKPAEVAPRPTRRRTGKAGR